MRGCYFPFRHSHHLVWTPPAALCQTCQTMHHASPSLFNLFPIQPNVIHSISVPYSQLETDWSIELRCSPVKDYASAPFAKLLRSALSLWVKYTFLSLQY